MIKATCKDCPERREGCHTECEKYREFLKRLKEVQSRRKKETFYNSVTIEAIYRGKEKARKRRGKR